MTELYGSGSDLHDLYWPPILASGPASPRLGDMLGKFLKSIIFPATSKSAKISILHARHFAVARSKNKVDLKTPQDAISFIKSSAKCKFDER